MSKIKFVMQIDISLYSKGDQVELECSRSGRPIDRFWRDAIRNGSIAFAETKTKKFTTGSMEVSDND